MVHFSTKHHMYIFRLPVGWQFLTNRTLGGPLDQVFLKKYDSIVQQCLAVGAYCIIDIHNYGHYDGKIIGQSGPNGVTNDHFVSLWSQLAKKYAKKEKVIFGIMNEPHNLNVPLWRKTCQLVVNAIRAAGAKKQLILIPGSEYSHVSGDGGFPNYSGPELLKVKDYDGSNNKLIFDVHEYYSDYGGEKTECITNHINDGFEPTANFLRAHGRYALLPETGGLNSAKCVKYVCQALDFINKNSDVYMGWVGWAAGSFDMTYEAIETPFANGTDQLLVRKCIAGKLNWD